MLWGSKHYWVLESKEDCLKKKKKTASGFNLISDSRFYFRMTLVLGGSDVHSTLENNAFKWFWNKFKC